MVGIHIYQSRPPAISDHSLLFQDKDSKLRLERERCRSICSITPNKTEIIILFCQKMTYYRRKYIKMLSILSMYSTWVTIWFLTNPLPIRTSHEVISYKFESGVTSVFGLVVMSNAMISDHAISYFWWSLVFAWCCGDRSCFK